ncbi:MAG TPA: signal recognition particle protein, partial [Chromatiales bacterium]|nr:signal recognition particle protein [Chromatiales bacterium]
MFDNLTQRLSGLLDKMRGQGRLTEENIQDALREVRMALLEADVALPVVREFTAKVKERAVGQEVLSSLTPGQAFIKIVHDELVAIMGEANEALNLATQPPAVVLMAGLQGAGKTTTVGKLARVLKEQKKKVMVVSCDVYRPAAIKQLETLAGQVGVDFFPSDQGQDPVAIGQAALHEARIRHMDVLLVDTAGRLHVDEAMMDEARRLHAALNPVETLFVVDSMTGQDAANTAKAFNDALPLTGVILTKADGDARGGAALSVRQITGKPIKFLGQGEKLAALEPFHPERVASRILGMGDVLSLVEEATKKIDQDKAKALVDKVKAGKSFNMEDLKTQLEQMLNMGGMASLMDKLPGVSKLPEHVKAQANDRDVKRMIAIIQSMTPAERNNPHLIDASRRRRIARGAGVPPQEVAQLVKSFDQM